MSSSGAADAGGVEAGGVEAGAVVACLKWVDRRAEVDPLTGAVRTDRRTSGASNADEAALEWALRAGKAWGRPVVVVTAGRPESEPMLRDALAAGASAAVRVDINPAEPSATVAEAIAGVLGDAGSCPANLVVCGAWSVDRGSGSFPAFLAGELGAAQALGLVGLSFRREAPGSVSAERRLDRGRRERLVALAPAVVSVEASTARLRRAGLDAVLAAQEAPIILARPRSRASPRKLVHDESMERVTVAALRPRPRVLTGPRAPDARGRVLELVGTGAERPAARIVALAPAGAADALLAQLRVWGYLR